MTDEPGEDTALSSEQVARLHAPASRVELLNIVHGVRLAVITQSQFCLSLVTKDSARQQIVAQKMVAALDKLGAMADALIGPQSRTSPAQAGSSPKAQMNGYPVGIVGESHYQAEIRSARVGDAVSLVQEIGNPYDPNAIAVVLRSGETIGYIARDTWVTRALIDEERGCDATITAIARSDGGALGVVLDVVLTDGVIGRRAYKR